MAVEISKSQTAIVLPFPRWGSCGRISRREGAVGFEGGSGTLHKKVIPPILSGSLGRSGHNSAAPCAPAGAGAFAAAVLWPQASRPKRVHPEARLSDCRPARSTAAGPRDWNAARGETEAASEAESGQQQLLQLDKHGCCRRRRRLPGPRSFPQRRQHLLEEPISLINIQQQAKFAAGGQPAPCPPAGYLKGGGGRGARGRPAGHWPRGEEVRGVPAG